MSNTVEEVAALIRQLAEAVQSQAKSGGFQTSVGIMPRAGAPKDRMTASCEMLSARLTTEDRHELGRLISVMLGLG